MRHGAPVADLCRNKRATGANDALFTNGSAGAHCGTGSNNGIPPDCDIDVDVGGCRIDNSYASQQVPGQNPPAQDGAGLCELVAVIHTKYLFPGRRHSRDTLLLLCGECCHIGQVILTAGVRPQCRYALREPDGIEAIDARVDLGDGPLALVALLLLANAQYPACSIAQDAPIPGRVRGYRRHQREHGFLLPVNCQERCEGLSGNERRVPIQHEQGAGQRPPLAQRIQRLMYGMAGAELLVLMDIAISCTKNRLHALSLVAKDQNGEGGRAQSIGRYRRNRGQNVIDERATGDRMEDFRKMGAHTRALARGQHHGRICIHHVIAKAGALGFEPRNGGSKVRCLTAWLRPNRNTSTSEPQQPDRPYLMRSPLPKRHRSSSELGPVWQVLENTHILPRPPSGCNPPKAPFLAERPVHAPPCRIMGEKVTERAIPLPEEVHMRLLIAPQALKGSLTAAATARAIAAGVRTTAPDALVTEVPIADGGEGTVEALVAATSGEIIASTVTGPLGEPVAAFFGILGAALPDVTEGTAIIEMAAASGLPLVPPEQRDPRLTTTRGTGELIRHALDRGCRRLLIGIGGSATNDGGAGMAQALGAHLLDDAGHELPPGGAALAHLAHIALGGLDPRLRNTVVQVACDVDNPLCGPNGASAIYGPQKGATPAMVAELDEALRHYAAIIDRDLGVDVLNLPGAGAAGGLGAGLVAFLHAELLPGAQMVLDALQFDTYLANADLVITAEGHLDMQTLRGKSVGAVAAAAKAREVPVIVIAGGVGEDERDLYAMGIAAIVPLPTHPMTLAEAMSTAAPLASRAAERAIRLIQIGQRNYSAGEKTGL
jgi:glycerate kinase